MSEPAERTTLAWRGRPLGYLVERPNAADVAPGACRHDLRPFGENGRHGPSLAYPRTQTPFRRGTSDRKELCLMTSSDVTSGDEASSASRRVLSRGVKALRWLLGALLVALTVRLISADPAPLRQLAQVPYSILAALALLMVLNQWLMSWRFQLVMKEIAKAEAPRLEWFRLTSVGQFLNMFVPQLGHVYRAWVLERERGVSYLTYALGMSVFFWFEVLTGLALAVAVLSCYAPDFRVAMVPVLPLIAAGFLLLLAAPLGFEFAARWLPSNRNRLWTALQRTARSFRQARESLHLAFIAPFVAINMLVAAVQVATLALAFTSVGSSLGLGRLMLFQVLLKLSSVILLTPGNIGLTELAYGILSDSTQDGLQQGIAVAVLMRVLGSVVIIGLGICFGGLSILRSRGYSSAQ